MNYLFLVTLSYNVQCTLVNVIGHYIMKLKNIIYIIFFDQIYDQELQPNRSSSAVFASSKPENTTIVVIHYHLCIKISSIHLYTHKQKLVSR